MFQEANECITPVILGTWVHPGGLWPSNPRHLLGWHNSAQRPASVQVTPDTTFTVWLAQSHRNLETIAMAFGLLFATRLDVKISTGSLSLTIHIPGRHWNRQHRDSGSFRLNVECEGLEKCTKSSKRKVYQGYQLDKKAS